jgi:hypothetical protein
MSTNLIQTGVEIMQHQYDIHAFIGDDFHDTHHHVTGTYRACMKEIRSRKRPWEHFKIIEKTRM